MAIRKRGESLNKPVKAKCPICGSESKEASILFGRFKCLDCGNKFFPVT